MNVKIQLCTGTQKYTICRFRFFYVVNPFVIYFSKYFFGFLSFYKYHKYNTHNRISQQQKYCSLFPKG